MLMVKFTDFTGVSEQKIQKGSYFENGNSL